MIDITQAGWDWPVLYENEVEQPALTVSEPIRARVSAILGPDGEPLMVGYGRPKLGFDLTPRRN
jgi:hypothetical protein